MVHTIIFDKNYNAKRINDFKFDRKGLYWTHMVKSDHVRSLLLKNFVKSAKFVDDLLEEQRPGIIEYDGFHVIVLTFPTKKTRTLQVTFILSKNKIITITDRETSTINRLVDDISSNKLRITGVTDVFSLIIDEIIEKSVEQLERLEEDVEKEDGNIFKNKANKNLLSKTNLIKEDLFFISKLLRGDLEVVLDNGW